MFAAALAAAEPLAVAVAVAYADGVVAVAHADVVGVAGVGNERFVAAADGGDDDAGSGVGVELL